MFWFRVAILFSIFVDLFWAIGLITGMLLMITGSANSMTADPTMNNTLTSYVFLLLFQFAILILCLFGFFTCFKIWRNHYMMDAKLRKLFVLWVGTWIGTVLGALATAIYALIRVKDPQGQMGYMYEMFQKYAIDPKFAGLFERYQKDHSCCGIYGPDDWLILQLRASPGGGGGGMFQSGSMDYGFQQNPSTGKCHILQPLIPPGCGPMIMKEVNMKLGMYAALSVVQVFIGLAAAILAWYCFFYWLEKEVIVIPEDEVSNIVVIEPDDSYSSVERRATVYPSQGVGVHYGSNYMRQKRTEIYSSAGLLDEDSKEFGPASTIHHNHTQILHPQEKEHLGHNHTQQTLDRNYSHEYLGHNHTQQTLNHNHTHETVNHNHTHMTLDHSHMDPHHTHANLDHHHTHQDFEHGLSSLPLPPAMMHSTLHHFVPTSSNPIPLHHNSFTHNPALGGAHHHEAEGHHQQHEHKPMTHDEIVNKQLKTLGGTVLAKMHVDQKLDADGKEKTRNPNEHKKKKATLAIIRNKHKNDPPPPPPPGAHGQTGNLAQDIAAMGGGKKVQNKIEDVMITENPGKKLHAEPKPEILGSITGFGAGSALNNLLERGGATEAKRRENERKAEEVHSIRPIVIGTNARLHGGGGSLLHDIGKKQEEDKRHEHDHGGSGSGAPHGNHTMKYLPLNHHTPHHVPPSTPDQEYHAKPPATLASLTVHGAATATHHHSHDRSSTGFSLGGLGHSSVLRGHQDHTHHHPSLLAPGTSFYDPRSSFIASGQSYYEPSYAHAQAHGHHSSLLAPGQSFYEPRPSLLAPPGSSLFAPGSSLLPPMHNDHHQHRASVYITPEHRHDHPSTSSQAPTAHRPTLFIRPKRKHSRLSRILQHRNASRSKRIVTPPASVSIRRVQPSILSSSFLRNHHDSTILQRPSPVPRHSRGILHGHAHGSLISTTDRHSRALLHDHRRHGHEHEQGSRHAHHRSRDTLLNVALPPHHHLHNPRSRESVIGRVNHHAGSREHHVGHHLHHEPSYAGPAGRQRARSAYNPRSRYINNDIRNDVRPRRYMDDEQRSLNNNSRYLRGNREHGRYINEDREDVRSRSPRRLLYDDNDDDYDYQPPPPEHRSQHRSRSSYRRREEENARVLYKNPRRLDDSD